MFGLVKVLEEIQINEIRNKCNNNSLRWTNHIITRLFQRNIALEDVIHAINNGEIIEHYPTDYPYPSCLVLGVTRPGKVIHVVCGITENNLWLITAYYPNLEKWNKDFKTRKEIL